MAGLVHGDEQVVRDPYTTVIGNRCVIEESAHHCYVQGDFNKIKGAHCTVIGSYNELFARPDLADGHHNHAVPSRRERSRSPIRSPVARARSRSPPRRRQLLLPLSSSSYSSRPAQGPLWSQVLFQALVNDMSTPDAADSEAKWSSLSSSSSSSRIAPSHTNWPFSFSNGWPYAASQGGATPGDATPGDANATPAEADTAVPSGLHCSICMDKPIAVIVEPCQHAYMCSGCSKKTASNRKCIICKGDIKKRKTIYVCGSELASASAPAPSSILGAK